MIASRVFRHQNYELVCSANAVGGGKFTPALVISKQVWPNRPRVIAMQRRNFLTEETAIDAAFAQGVEWVRNYG
jgi:hypothetical protein